MKSMMRLAGLALASICLASAYTVTQAKFANVWEPVPVNRLLVNMAKYTAAHPNDAQGWYTLGRLHSLAFAQAEAKIEVVSQKYSKSELPSFAPYEQEFMKPQKPPVTLGTSERAHILQSLSSYQQAATLNPKDGVALLGIAWMLEQGSRYAPQLGSVNDVLAGKTAASKGITNLWLDASLRTYRAAYKLLLAPEQTKPLGTHTALYSPEAGEGIIRLLSNGRHTRLADAEILRIQQQIKEIRERPHPITPIIIGGSADAKLIDLLNPEMTVKFDLAGTGMKSKWPWVRPNTGILVWDPEMKGHITSGRQLFGSQTWQMFWSDGYEPLAALDNNSDGVLTGTELQGISVWHDRNANGRADAGEVVPCRTAGIASISVRGMKSEDDVLCNHTGVVMRDGTRLPSFDWTPTSLK